MEDTYYSYVLDDDTTVLLNAAAREELALELLRDIWAEGKMPAPALQAIDKVLIILAERRDFRHEAK